MCCRVVPYWEQGGACGDDAWIGEQVSDLEFAAAKATVVRESAHDHLRTMFVQCELARSLAASVRTSYEMAGVSG